MRRTLLILAFLSGLSMLGCDGGEGSSDGGLGADAARPPEPCDEPGRLESVACGQCGTTERFCTADGVWEYGLCEGEGGECTPGASRDGECGNCGVAQQVCSATCTWETTGDCSGEGTCAEGDLVRSGEGCLAGQRDLRCSDACVLEPISECESDPCTSPGVSETVACGRCGSRTRFCTAAGEWEYGTCGSEGTCTPGASREADCGNCGTRTERCDDSCGWTPFGSCTGEGECAPGSTTVDGTGCAAGSQRPLLCSDSCVYAPSGPCGSSAGGLGDLCTTGSCSAGLTCYGSDGPSICRESCTEAVNCTAPTTCFTTPMICSDDCTLFTDAGCPSGMKCNLLRSADFLGAGEIVFCGGVGSQAAGTACTMNSQCRRAHVCLLNEGSTTDGVCAAICDASHPCPTGTCSETTAAGYCS